MSRLVIGLGFREGASAQSIREVVADVFARASHLDDDVVLAVADDKAAHPGLLAAMKASAWPVETVGTDAMRRADARVATRSERVLEKRGVGSLCEAAALAVAGDGARLVVTRTISADRHATAAAAIRKLPS